MRTSPPVVGRAPRSSDVDAHEPAAATGVSATRRWLALAFVVAAVATDLNLSIVAEGSLPTVLINAFWVGIAGAAIVLVAGPRGPRRPRRTLLGHDWLYLAWVGFLVGSMTWSVSTRETLVDVVPLVLVWLAALSLRAVPSTDAVRAVVAVAVGSAVLSLLTLAVSTDVAYQPFSTTGAAELRGIFRHQLRLGAFMALALGLLVIARLRGDLHAIRTRSRIANVSVVVLLAGVLLLSRARLYPIEAAVALGLTIVLSRRGLRKWAFLAVAVVVALVIAQQFDTILRDLQYSGFDTSLTGRDLVWERTLSGVTEGSRALGYGYGTLDLPMFDYLHPVSYRAGHAHSSYLQAFFETGQVGLLALVGIIAVQLGVAWRYSVRCNTYSYSLFLVLFTAVGSLTGLVYAGALTAMFCLMMLFLAIESREVPARDAPKGAGPLAPEPGPGPP